MGNIASRATNIASPAGRRNRLMKTGNNTEADWVLRACDDFGNNSSIEVFYYQVMVGK
jgi:hypothetical protein